MRTTLLSVSAMALVALTACETVPVADATTQTVTTSPVQTSFQPYAYSAPIQTIATDAIITISGDVAFDTSSARIKREFMGELDSIADQLSASGSTQFTVIGHTDIRGSQEYNQALSERRARSVANYLISRGVPRDYLQVRGEGESNPVDAGTSESAHRSNRRVEILGSAGTYSPSYQVVQQGSAVPQQVVQVQPQRVSYAPGYSYTQALPRYTYQPNITQPALESQPTAPTYGQPQYQTVPTLQYTQQPAGGYVAPVAGQPSYYGGPGYTYANPSYGYQPQTTIPQQQGIPFAQPALTIQTQQQSTGTIIPTPTYGN